MSTVQNISNRLNFLITIFIFLNRKFLITSFYITLITNSIIL